MARRGHCPACSEVEGSPVIVELPHDCPNQPYQGEEHKQPSESIKAAVERDEEGRPVGQPFRPMNRPAKPQQPPQ
jgi:hypothetical protein